MDGFNFEFEFYGTFTIVFLILTYLKDDLQKYASNLFKDNNKNHNQASVISKNYMKLDYETKKNKKHLEAKNSEILSSCMLNFEQYNEIIILNIRLSNNIEKYVNHTRLNLFIDSCIQESLNKYFIQNHKKIYEQIFE